MVPTEDAIITRQMLYSALPVPATAAFAITSSIYVTFLVLHMHCNLLQSQALHGLEKTTNPGTGSLPSAVALRPESRWSRLFLLQNCAYRQFRSGQHRKLPLPLVKARHRKDDNMRPRAKRNRRRGAAHVLAVKDDVGAGGRRTEITLCFF